MAKTTLQTLKGFRDFLPAEKRKRDYVASSIKKTFELFGFQPLETPTIEYASLLMGKYGEEADKLLYSFKDRGDRDVALRYDQTVPTARVLAQYQNELPKFFRRYQMQNVFRADKPQKGRFREFAQCDCDIFGSTDLIADAEILAVYAMSYLNIGFKSFIVEVNDRDNLVNTLSPFTNEKITVFSLIQTIDKLDKQSQEEVKAELTQKGLSARDADTVFETLLTIKPSTALQSIIDMTVSLGVPRSVVRFNPFMARGLDYYTGLIFEGKIVDYSVGSVGGGGRYNNLIEQLSGLAVPAVGFGIGFDRTVEAADQLGLIPTDQTAVQAMVTIIDEKSITASLTVARQLRAAGVATEVYPSQDKLGKQFKLADQKGIPYAIVIGEEEIDKGVVTLKNLKSGEQTQNTVQNVIALLKT